MYRKLVLYVIVVAMAQGGAVTLDYMADDGAVKLLHGVNNATARNLAMEL